MLLEQLAEKVAQPPEFDWESYYAWFFGRLFGEEGSRAGFWQCRNCLAVNAVRVPVRHAKCRCCGIDYIG